MYPVTGAGELVADIETLTSSSVKATVALCPDTIAPLNEMPSRVTAKVAVNPFALVAEAAKLMPSNVAASVAEWPALAAKTTAIVSSVAVSVAGWPAAGAGIG